MESFRRIAAPVLVAACGAALIALTLRLARAEDPPVTTPDRSRLVITRASYGDLPAGARTDVTRQVAAMVAADALSVEATNDNFGDPASGTVKKLRVDYTFDGKSKSKMVDEGETLTISNAGE